MTTEAPPPYSAMGFWCRQLTQSQFEQVMRDIGKDGAKLFRLYREVGQDSLKLRTLPPEERLAAFTMRDPAAWQILMDVFPQHYKDDQLDWFKLLQRLEAGELDEDKYNAALDALIMVQVPVA